MSRRLLSVSDALDRILAVFNPLPGERVALDSALSRVLAENVTAETDLPPFPNSAMDGYAVRSSDVEAASGSAPTSLVVVGDISAGEGSPAPIGPGQAMRIMTGAALPPGADAVVPVELTSLPAAMAGEGLPDHVTVVKAVKAGDFVRRAGQDVRRDTRVLSAGLRLRPQDIAMLAALGVAKPLVHQRPKVAIISSGDELVQVDQPLGPGQIRDANGYGIEAAVRLAGADPLRLRIAKDARGEIRERLANAVQAEADLIVSSAGVSMGAKDFVRVVLEAEGRLEFWRVDIRPGKPLAFGSYQGVPFIGLPGNPVSALVTFEVFVRPTLDRMAGLESTERHRLIARLKHRISSDGREGYLRASLTWEKGEYWASLSGSQDSGVLSSLVKGNALVGVRSGVKHIEQGASIEAWLMKG